MKTMIKFSFVLAAYSVIACVALAFVYNVTAPIIQARAASDLKASLIEIFPDASDFTDVSAKVQSGNPSIVFENAFVAKNASGVLGLIIKVTGPTYAKGTMLVGANVDGTLKPVKFMSLTDTPGLGLKALAEKFKGQFTGKKVSDAFKAGNTSTGADIAAISGATITSKGVSNMVRLAGTKAADYLAQE